MPGGAVTKRNFAWATTGLMLGTALGVLVASGWSEENPVEERGLKQSPAAVVVETMPTVVEPKPDNADVEAERKRLEETVSGLVKQIEEQRRTLDGLKLEHEARLASVEHANKNKSAALMNAVGFVFEGRPTDGSVFQLMNWCSASADPYVRAMGTRLSIAAAADDKQARKICRFELKKPGAQPSRSMLAAADYLGQNMPAEEREELAGLYETTPYPRNWGVAVALARAGEAVFLDTWSVSTLEFFENHNAKVRDALQALEACELVKLPDIDAIAEQAAKHTNSKVKRACVEMLGRSGGATARRLLNALTGDSDRVVSLSAQKALREINRR